MLTRLSIHSTWIKYINGNFKYSTKIPYPINLLTNLVLRQHTLKGRQVCHVFCRQEKLCQTR